MLLPVVEEKKERKNEGKQDRNKKKWNCNHKTNKDKNDQERKLNKKEKWCRWF